MQTVASERVENRFPGTLPQPDAQRLLQVSRTKRYAAGEKVYGLGEIQQEVLLLVEGAIKVWVKEPQPLILEVVFPGEVFGELCISGPARHEEYAEAIVPSVLRVFPAQRLFDSNGNGDRATSVGHRLLSLYCKRASEARRQWRSTVSEDVPQRVGRRLMELLRYVPDAPGMAAVPIRLRQEDLAYMVGSTRTTVSEILNDFERRGLVELRRASFRVDRAKLQKTLWPS